VMIKPDGIDRGIAGELMTRIEKKGYRIVAMKMLRIDESMAREHYRDHLEKSFFPKLLHFVTSGPVIAMVVEGLDVISAMRKLFGKTNPLEAETGTLRGDYGVITTYNLIHASDSPKSAEREIPIFFKESEIISYERSIDKWFDPTIMFDKIK